MRVHAWRECIIGDKAGEYDQPRQLSVTRGYAQQVLQRDDALVGLQNCKLGGICHGNINLFRAWANGADNAMMCDVIRGGQKLTSTDLYADDRESGDNDSDDSDDSDDDGSEL